MSEISPKASEASEAPGAQDLEAWWNDFKSAVEDPNVSIYHYLRESLLDNLEIENKHSYSAAAKEARKDALRGILKLKNPRELSRKLQNLEKNTLIFGPKTRSGIKLIRVLIDSAAVARNSTKESKGIIEGALVENHVAQDIENIVKQIKNVDQKDVEKTIQEASRQLSADDNLEELVKDVVKLSDKYFNILDKITNIAIISLPLITWKYRWALAVGLGAYASKKAVYHGAKAAHLRIIKRDKSLAREESKKTVLAIKSAWGDVLIIGLSPFMGKLPKILKPAAGFVNWGVKTVHDAVLDTLKKMLDDEKNKPGTTPLSKTFKKKTKSFLEKHQDKLATSSARLLKNAAPSTITVVLSATLARLSFKKITRVFVRMQELKKSILKRHFNGKAIENHSDLQDSTHKLQNGINDVKRTVGEIKKTLTEEVKKKLKDQSSINLSNAYQISSPPKNDENFSVDQTLLSQKDNYESDTTNTLEV